MKNQSKKLLGKFRRGMTLIELCVVVAIIGIIGYFAGPSLISLVTGSSEATAQANADALNEWCNVAESGGVTWAATGSVGSKGVPGRIPNTDAAAAIAAIKAGVFTRHSGSTAVSYQDFRGTVASYTLVAHPTDASKRRFSVATGATTP